MNIDRIPGREKPKTISEMVEQEVPEDPRVEAPPSRQTDINAAIPNFFLGLCYALAAFWDIVLPHTEKQWLSTMMAVEVLVIHSFPFMMLIASYNPTTAKGKKFQRTVFWSMLGIYFIFAAQMGGPPGMIAFAGLTVTTYLGYLLRRTSPGAVGQLVIRWAMTFLIFIITSAACRMPGDGDAWPGHPRLAYFGMSYFLLLGYLEWSGFYHSSRVLLVIDMLKAKWHSSRRGI